MRKGIRKDRLVVLLLVMLGIWVYFSYKNGDLEAPSSSKQVFNFTTREVPNSVIDGINASLDGLNNMEDTLQFDSIVIEEKLDLDKQIL